MDSAAARAICSRALREMVAAVVVCVVFLAAELAFTPGGAAFYFFVLATMFLGAAIGIAMTRSRFR